MWIRNKTVVPKNLSDINVSMLHCTAVQLSQSAYFALQCPYTVFGLGRTPNFVDELAVGMPRSSDAVRTVKQNS